MFLLHCYLNFVNVNFMIHDNVLVAATNVADVLGRYEFRCRDNGQACCCYATWADSLHQFMAVKRYYRYR